MSGTDKFKNAANKAKQFARSEKTQAALGHAKSAATSAPAKKAYKLGGIAAAVWVGLSAAFGGVAALTADDFKTSTADFVNTRFGIGYEPNPGNCFYVDPSNAYDVTYYAYETNAFWEHFKVMMPFVDGKATPHQLGTVGAIEQAPCDIIKDSVTVFGSVAAANDYSLEQAQSILDAAQSASLQAETAGTTGFIKHRLESVSP